MTEDEKIFNLIKGSMLEAVNAMKWEEGVTLEYSESWGNDSMQFLGNHSIEPYYTGNVALNIEYNNPQLGGRNKQRILDRRPNAIPFLEG